MAARSRYSNMSRNAGYAIGGSLAMTRSPIPHRHLRHIRPIPVRLAGVPDAHAYCEPLLATTFRWWCSESTTAPAGFSRLEHLAGHGIKPPAILSSRLKPAQGTHEML